MFACLSCLAKSQWVLVTMFLLILSLRLIGVGAVILAFLIYTKLGLDWGLYTQELAEAPYTMAILVCVAAVLFMLAGLIDHKFRAKDQG